MPELPEVETIRAGLAQQIVGERVEHARAEPTRLFRKNARGHRDVTDLLVGNPLKGVERRGKFLWLLTGGEDLGKDDANLAFVVHLGMSGQVRVRSEGPAANVEELGKHEHLRLHLTSGTQISFVDQRTFGHLSVSSLVDCEGRTVPALMSHIAPDPLETVFDAASVIERGQKSRRRIKTLLLDQTLVSGIGNIYADEALHRAGIPGTKLGSELPEAKWLRVLDASRDVMVEALAAGGTSFDDLYVDVEGNPGYFERALAVYGKRGKECPGCAATVERIVVDGRSHFYCPNFCNA